MRRKISFILNIVIVLLMATGLFIMLTNKAASATGLTASGIENLKFYTVLTNIFCGIIALVSLFVRRESRALDILKLASLAGVMVTFLVILLFLGPIYGHVLLYKGSNLIFHLIEPVLAACEYLVTPRRKQPFIYCVPAFVPTLLYGSIYLANLLINGVGGPWPDTNDFYGFLNWGYPVGICIFIGITLLAFSVSLIFRYLGNKLNAKEHP